MQRGRWREHEGGEGRSSGKKDGDTTHQWGSSVDEVADGAVRVRFFEGGDALAMVAGSCSMGALREVREADQLKKKKGIGLAHWKRMVR
jgi:hypothetical protein